MPVKGRFGANKPTAQNDVVVEDKPIVDVIPQDPCDNKRHDINKFGVTYYKISDKSKMYGEDNTQDGCLNPNQLDANFNFLHGDDIKKGQFDREHMLLVLDRFFCDKDMAKYAKTHPSIGPIKISTENILSGTSFNSETGVLTLVFNGEETEIKGFNTIDPEEIFDIITEYLQEKLKGVDGSYVNITPEETKVGIEFFDGGEINIEQ